MTVKKIWQSSGTQSSRAQSNPAQFSGAQQSGSAGHRRGTASGPGRVLVAVYGIFAVSASARAGYQIAGDFQSAPVPYLMSAFAAALYVVATIALARTGPVMRAVAWGAVLVELVGVVVVGALSVTWPDLFPVASVWSHFGAGYGYVPLVLPLLGMLWLWYDGKHR